MSGHSKWHNIQERKGKQDAKRSNLFTKYAKLITVAAQKGGDPAMNFSLRLAIDKAKSVGMPKDNIDRAVRRGTGEEAGERMEEVVYEAFGPGGVAIIIKALTDNKNRTVSDLKHILNVHDGSFGGIGSVMWNFDQRGIFVISKQLMQNREETELSLIEAGAEDISDVDGAIEVRTKIENFQKISQALKGLGLEPTEASLKFVPKEKIKLDTAMEEKLAGLFADLEAHDDVEDYFTNAE